jgi:dTDP-4-amino-4,6-dideoxygalactose transaminase
MIKFLDLVAQYQTIKPEIDQVIQSVITESAFIGGEYLTDFERDFSEYSDTKFCVGVANGTDGLEIAIESLDLPSGSEIIVPANSFISSSEAVTRQRHKVVFADCEPDSYVLSIDDVKKRITPQTKAIIAVHLYGHPCDMDALIELAKIYDLYIIEDCAQAHGAEYKGKKVGGIGHIASFSFYPGKNLGAYGDGGAITTNDENLAKKSRMIANHGRVAKYDHVFEGRNSRLDGLQAGILSVKLRHLPIWTEIRIQLANYYSDQLKAVKQITLPTRQIWAKQVYHLYVIRTDQREALAEHLTSKGIQTGIHYPIALPKLKAYEYLNQAGEMMFANKSDNTLLSLPIGEHLSLEDADVVVRAIKQFFE